MVIKKQNINNLHQNIFECASLGDYQQLDDILKDNDNVSFSYTLLHEIFLF